MKYVLVLFALFFIVAPRVLAAPGELGDTCRPAPNQCNTGLECNEGRCTEPCGGTGQQCCQTTDVSRLCDPPSFNPEFQDLFCNNPTTPANGVCQLNSCGGANQICCTHGQTQCRDNFDCVKNKCLNPIRTGTPTPTLTNTPTPTFTGSLTRTPTRTPGGSSVVIPGDPDRKAFYSPNFMSVVIQIMFFILTLAVIFSVIR